MSRYDEYLNHLKATHQNTAREATRILYELLSSEDPNLSKEDIYDRIMKDLLAIWSRQTIVISMPHELKDKERQDAGKKGAEAKKEIIVTNDGNVAVPTKANQTPVGQKEPKSPSVNISDELLADDDDDAPAMPNLQTTKDPAIADLERENKELKEAMEKMNLFNKASEIPATTAQTTDEVFLPAEKLGNLFMMSRDEKTGIWLRVNPQTRHVTWMEANHVRAKAQNKAQQQQVKTTK